MTISTRVQSDDSGVDTGSDTGSATLDQYVLVTCSNGQPVGTRWPIVAEIQEKEIQEAYQGGDKLHIFGVSVTNYKPNVSNDSTLRKVGTNGVAVVAVSGPVSVFIPRNTTASPDEAAKSAMTSVRDIIGDRGLCVHNASAKQGHDIILFDSWASAFQ